MMRKYRSRAVHYQIFVYACISTLIMQVYVWCMCTLLAILHRRMLKQDK